MSYTVLHNLNNIGSSLNQQFATAPGTVTGPATNPVLNPVATGVLASGSGLQQVGSSSNSIGTINTGVSNSNTGTITAPNTGILTTPSITSREVLEAVNNQNTPVAEESFWDKNKVWIVAVIALILIGTGLYFLLKK